jgi:hypothetical protein
VVVLVVRMKVWTVVQAKDSPPLGLSMEELRDLAWLCRRCRFYAWGRTGSDNRAGTCDHFVQLSICLGPLPDSWPGFPRRPPDRGRRCSILARALGGA